MRIMSSKAMDEVNKPLGWCRYIVNVVRISYFLSIDFSIWGFDNGKKKKVKGNFISICDARLIVEMLCAY